MHYSRQFTASYGNPAVVLLILLPLLQFSCVSPKKGEYPVGKPFVYKIKTKLEANLPNDEKQDLFARLQDQMDDSLRTNIVTALRWKPPFIYKKLVAPAAFDTGSVKRSMAYMNGLLVSRGFYAPQIQDSFYVKKVKAHLKNAVVYQYRTTVEFMVRPGKRLILDSVGFDLSTPALQALSVRTAGASLLKKGLPYSKQKLSAEISRLVDTFRNHGYYRFSKEDLYVEQDTVLAGLIDPTLDPFQQTLLLEKLEKKRDNPTLNIVVKQRPVRDSTHLMRYYISKVTAYTDLPLVEDTTYSFRQDTTKVGQITMITRSDIFKLPFVSSNIYLRPGELYTQENYFRTFNRFNQLSAWQYLNIEFVNSPLADSLLDVILRMYPAKKQNVNYALELARNTNDIVTATNLFGVALSVGLANRNAYKQSVRKATNLRGGVELGKDFIQTVQASISHSIIFPRLIVPFNIYRETSLKNIQTVLNVNASYVDRRQFYTLRSLNGSWGYQWKKGNATYLYKPINIEYTISAETDSLKNILAQNPSLRLAFRTGLVIGQQFGYSSILVKGKTQRRFRFSLEESGALLGLIAALDQGELLRFVRGDIEYVHNMNFRKTQLVLRAYGGMGYAFGRQGNGYAQTLPFFKAYFAGGPNSMRAWQVRQLGLGSSKYYSYSPYIGLDRFGDVQLEGNAEFRFPLGSVFGYKLRSVIFTDAGNVWNWRPIDSSAAAIGSDFKLNRFYKEIAVGAGTGLRLDFNFFAIRLDWAYKIKDPQQVANSTTWFYNLSLGSGQFQLGINYPF